MSADGRQRTTRETKRFDSTKLAEQMREALEDKPPADEAEADDLALPRTRTLEDPITTGVLAEVARQPAEQLELDDQGIEDAVENLGDEPTSHPHLRRRR